MDACYFEEGEEEEKVILEENTMASQSKVDFFNKRNIVRNSLQGLE